MWIGVIKDSHMFKASNNGSRVSKIILVKKRKKKQIIFELIITAKAVPARIMATTTATVLKSVKIHTAALHFFFRQLSLFSSAKNNTSDEYS